MSDPKPEWIYDLWISAASDRVGADEDLKMFWKCELRRKTAYVWATFRRWFLGLLWSYR